jgi:hypothetical protein
LLGVVLDLPKHGHDFDSVLVNHFPLALFNFPKGLGLRLGKSINNPSRYPARRSDDHGDDEACSRVIPPEHQAKGYVGHRYKGSKHSNYLGKPA